MIRVFLDTEFTGIVADPKLISIGFPFFLTAA